MINAAETCRQNGWIVGDVLEGDQGHGVSRIAITAIGDRLMLAVEIWRNGKPLPADELSEGSWSLNCRDWKKVSG
jgi:hypothetical protein